LSREQDAAGDAAPEARVLLGVLEEVHHFGELGLGLVDARDVLEGDALLGRLGASGPRATETAERIHPAPLARGPAGEVDEQRDDEQDRPEAEQDVGEQARALVDGLRADLDLVVLQDLREGGVVGEGRDLGLEVVRRLLLRVRGVLDRLLELAVHGRAFRGDALHVAVLHLLEEDGAVGDPRRGLGAVERGGDRVVDREQHEDDRDGRRAASAGGGWSAAPGAFRARPGSGRR
jgi:hypothetical protein